MGKRLGPTGTTWLFTEPDVSFIFPPIHLFIHTFSILLSLWLWLFNIYAKPGAGHMVMADLDLPSTGEETDRWTRDCCTVQCGVGWGKPGCCLSCHMVGREQEDNRRVAIARQTKTNVHPRHFPEVSRKDSPFFQPAVSNALQFVAYQRWFSKLLGRKGRQRWWARFIFYLPPPHLS